MNRKNFLTTILPVTIATALYKNTKAAPFVVQPTLTPANLKIGDTIGVTCPASPTDYNKIKEGIKALKHWGLNVQIGETVGKHWQRFGGTDMERAYDFQQMLDNDKIKAIIFAKGGYGTMRMIDKVIWDKFLQKPKWLIGYSDLTTMHLHIHANFDIPTIHGDMVTGFGDQPKDISANTLHDTLFGNRIEYSVGGHYMNRQGYATGKLVGGNLSLIQACAGSKSDIKTDGKILFIEDVSEYKYPVCFNFPSGHVPYNHALKMGAFYDFSVSRKSVTLFEKYNVDTPTPSAPKKMVLDTLIKVDSLEGRL